MVFVGGKQDLFKQLYLRLGAIRAGNNAPVIQAEAVALIDKLTELGHLSPADAKPLHALATFGVPRF